MEGRLIIFAAPSGSGKSTIVSAVLRSNDQLSFSISACTRKPRPDEVDGESYHFISQEEFKSHIDNDDFVEWEEVYPGNFYGTLKSELDKIWAEGKHVVFDIDVVGAVNLKKLFPDRSLAIFIKAPSPDVLEQRLRIRGTETEENLSKRLGKAKREMDYEEQFDYVLVNDKLEEAVEEANKVVINFISSVY